MNCSQAKQIPIIGFLASQGKHPVEIRNGQAVFHSPFKEDKDPSLYVDFKKYSLQVWKDFSTGAGGNILDLVMKMYNVDIAGALIILQKPEIAEINFSFVSQQNSNHDNSGKRQIKKIQSLQNRALIQYLSSRKISQSKAAIYLQEIYYTVKNKNRFSLAFQNDKGGFELRSKNYKSAISPKTITTIPGTNKTMLNIFEGMFDFLSALEYFKTNKPACTTIVLNSTSNLEHVIPSLKNYKKINLFLDNDTAGSQAAKTIKSRHPKVNDYSKIIYPDYSDFNGYLMKCHKKSTLQ